MTDTDLPYTRFAEIYDDAGHGEYADEVFRWLKGMLKKRKFQGVRALDLACGTGNLSLALAREGWDVMGIDISPFMLQEAVRKAESNKLKIEFSRMDIREIAIPRTFDLVISCYDGLNYMLSEEELWKVFCEVSKLLPVEGIFAFDMNTRQAYEQCWGSGIPYVVHKERFTLIMEARYDRKRRLGEMDITGFIRKGTSFERFYEYHAERPFFKTRVRRLLCKTGFKVEHTETFNPFPACGSRKEPFKALWLCRKVGEPEEGL